MTTEDTTTPSSDTEGGVVRMCNYCGINPRRPGRGRVDCRECCNAAARERYSDGRLKGLREEQRACAFPPCETKFTWRSSSARQTCCSRDHSLRLYQMGKAEPRPAPEVLPEGTKRCWECKQVVDVSLFSPTQFARKTGQCRPCSNTYMRGYRERNRESMNLKNKLTSTERKLARYQAYTVDIQQIIDDQGGVCASCRKVPDNVKGFHIDHNHASGMFRALLCHGCNVGAGALGDDPERMRRLADYVEQHRAQRQVGDRGGQ